MRPQALFFVPFAVLLVAAAFAAPSYATGPECASTLDPSLAEAAAEAGLELLPLAAQPASTPTCPRVRSCQATHCVETGPCTSYDLGPSCCTPGGTCLVCPTGQSIRVTECLCSGGGCTETRSLSMRCV